MTVNQRESELSSLRVSDLENLEKTVNTYYKGLLQAIKACLAVCCLWPLRIEPDHSPSCW